MIKQTVVILASGSPRRSEILTLMGVPYVVDVPDVDEQCEGDARAVVLALARRKAEAVSRRRAGAVVLAADTVVDCDGILGKPVDAGDAERMLRRLSGRWHEVYTGVCVINQDESRSEAACTRVHFMPLSKGDIDGYIRTGEPLDKAGAYAIQGMAGMFIDRIEGCPHNVMGLPMALTKQLLSR